MKNHRILIGLATVLALWLSYTLPMQAVERAALDGLSRFIPAKKFDSQVAVVAIDQASLEAWGPWPWKYATLAELLDKLNLPGVKSLGLLLPLSHSEDYSQKVAADAALQSLFGADVEKSRTLLQHLDHDSLLERALAKSGRVVLPVMYAIDPRLQNSGVELLTSGVITELSPADTAHRSPWFARLPVIFSGALPAVSITEAPLSRFSSHAKALGLWASTESWSLPQAFAVKVDGVFVPSFLGQMASQVAGPPTLVPGFGIRLDAVTAPSDFGYRFLPLPSLDRSGTLNVPIVSAADILNGASRKLPRSVQALLIGPTAGDSGADHLTAYGDIVTTPVVWLAHSLNALLNGELIQYPYWATGAQRLAILLLAVYLMLLPAKLRGWIGFAITVLLAVLIVNGGVLLLLVMNIYQPLALPALFAVVGHLLLTSHFKITNAFKSVRMEAANAYRELGLNLQSQGRLDQAFNYLRKCDMDTKLIECLYNLGLEFERRRQFNQAVAVYDYIARKDSEYRDIRERRVRHQSQSNRNMLSTTVNSHVATLVVDHPSVERPLLGRYQIEKVIGQGAMGTVYLGMDPKISRMVAIKALPLTDEFDSKHIEDVRKRFYREAETAGRLNHPNIVTVYDVGEEHDLAYIAMDYIAGEGLDGYGHPDNLLSLEEVFNIGITAAEALDYAHRQNVVHRDIKPGNIIFDRQTGNLKITDFGIACLTDNSRTRTGTVLGSPSYMSPEQLAGEAVDGRSDIYSLGVTLYQLFTGVLPFTADSMASLAYKIANSKPPGIRRIRPDLPACLTRVINKAIEKEPQLRYPTGSAFAEALRRCARS